MNRNLDLLIQILPFLLIVVVWIFIMQKVVKYNKNNKNKFEDKHNESMAVLKEIRDELKELNKNNSQK